MFEIKTAVRLQANFSFPEHPPPLYSYLYAKTNLEKCEFFSITSLSQNVLEYDRRGYHFY